jgi:hypothetical protein
MGLARSTFYDEPEVQPVEEARLVERLCHHNVRFAPDIAAGPRSATSQRYASG